MPTLLALSPWLSAIEAGGGPANQPPRVEVTTDIDGGRLWADQEVVVVGEASDDSGVELVEVSFDGGPRVTAQGTTLWSHTLDLVALDPGEHNISFRAYDGELYSDVETCRFTVMELPPPGEEDRTFAPGTLLVIDLVLIAFIGLVIGLIAVSQRRRRTTAAPPRKRPHR